MSTIDCAWLINFLPVPVFRKDVQGRFTFVNNAFCEFTRLREDQLLGQTDFDVFEPDLATQFSADDETLKNTFVTVGKVGPIDKPEVIIVAGKRVRIRTIKTCSLNPDNSLHGIHGVFLLYEREWEAQMLWALMLEKGTDIVYAHNEDGSILLLNAAGRAACGLCGEDELPESLSFMDWIPCASEAKKRSRREVFLQLIRKPFREHPTRIRRVFRLDFGYGTRVLEICVKKILDTPLATGAVVVGIARDITEQLRLKHNLAEVRNNELRKERLNVAIEAFDRAISDINHFMAHEFKNPLSNGQVSLSNLHVDVESHLRSIGVENRQIGPVTERIRRVEESLATAIQQINSFLRRVKNLESSIELVNPAGLVMSAKTALLGRNNIYEDRVIDFIDQSDSCLPKANVDKFWTQLAIHGVLKNAFEHGEPIGGDSTVRVLFMSRLEQIDGNAFIRCDINNSGAGFPSEVLRAWNASHQGLDPICPIDSARGSGVGLSLSRSFLQRQKIPFEMRISNGGPLGGALVSMFLPIQPTLQGAIRASLGSLIDEGRNRARSWLNMIQGNSAQRALLQSLLVGQVSAAWEIADSTEVVQSIFAILFRNGVMGRVHDLEIQPNNSGDCVVQGAIRLGCHVHEWRGMEICHNCPTICLAILSRMCSDVSFTCSQACENGLCRFAINIHCNR